jgi:hypothetical protein
MREAIPPLYQYAFMARCSVKAQGQFTFYDKYLKILALSLEPEVLEGQLGEISAFGYVIGIGRQFLRILFFLLQIFIRRSVGNLNFFPVLLQGVRWDD